MVPPPITEVTLPPYDLRNNTYEHLLRVRQPTGQEIEWLNTRGFDIYGIGSLSLREVVRANRDRFHNDTLQSPESNDPIVEWKPPRMMVAIPRLVHLPHLGDLPATRAYSQQEQLAIIDAFSIKYIEPDLPGAKAIMLPASALAQIAVFQSQIAGFSSGKFLDDIWLRALDITGQRQALSIGWVSKKPAVGFSHADLGDEAIVAVPAVILLQK